MFSLSNIRHRLSQNPIILRMSTGLAWTLAGNTAWRLLSAVATISVARILGPKAFGELGIILSTVSMFSVYAGLRLGITTTKYVAEYRIKNPERAARIMKLTLTTASLACAGAALVLVAAAGHLSNHVLQHPELRFGLILGALLLFFRVNGEIKQHTLTGFENFKAMAKTNILRGLAMPFLYIPLAYFWGVEGALAGLVAVAVFFFVTASRYLNREQVQARFPSRIPLSETRKEVPVLWEFALPGFLIGATATLVLWIGRIILTQQENGFAQLGLYHAADQWRTVILFLPAILARVILPILSETYGHESDKQFRETVSIQLQSIIMITLPLTVFVMGFAKPLALIFGRQFSGTESIIPLLMMSVFLYAMNQNLNLAMAGAGKRWTMFAFYIIWSVVFFSSCKAFIPTRHALGLAMARLTADTTLFLILFVYVNYFLAPGVLYKQLILIVYACLSVAIAYGVYVLAIPHWTIYLFVGLFLMTLLPLFHKLRLRRI